MHAHEPPRPVWARGGNRPVTVPLSLRVSDAERNEVIAALCRHYADGRLDEEEFNERQGRAGAAKTQGDLAPLLADLPRLGAMNPQPQPPRTRGRSLIVALVLVAVVWSALNSLSHLLHPQVPWALIVIAVFCLLRWQRHAVPASRGRRGQR